MSNKMTPEQFATLSAQDHEDLYRGLCEHHFLSLEEGHAHHARCAAAMMQTVLNLGTISVEKAQSTRAEVQARIIPAIGALYKLMWAQKVQLAHA